MTDTAPAPVQKAKKAAKPKKPASHPKYGEMIAAALGALKERTGSSRQAILKYITANYKCGDNLTAVNSHLKMALTAGVKSGALKQYKGTGASGSFKLGETKKATTLGKIILNETICKRVLNRSVRRLIEDLDVITVLDYSIEKEFLSSVECRDIKDEKVTSDKIRKVIEKVKEKGVEGYEQFKHLLKLARQEHLVKYLTNQESVIQKELQDETAKQERIKKQIAALGRRAATIEDLNYISQCIGSNWEILGPPLLKNKSTVTIEHIKEDHRSCQQRVYNLLLMWRQQTDDQSLAHLFHLMYKAGTSVTIDWNVIAENLKIERRDIQACKEGYQYPVQERTQQHDSEYQSQVHAQETKQQQDSDSKQSQKDSCIFDGRLILLDSNQVNDLEASLDKKPIGQGRIGIVYRCNNPDIFGIHVAVKKINTNGDSKIESQVRREKIACRLMNPFILPLLAVVEKSNEKREFWFVSPLCENGDLYEVLKHDRTKSAMKLNAKKRVKILLQVALAIQHIHTAVFDVRAVILHKDIASKNIVLDDMFNARLIDFGLAREEDDISTVAAGGRIYYSHPNVGKTKANESWDYYSFGVIVREMITTFGPEGDGTEYLKNMTAEGVTSNICEKIWNYESLRHVLGELKKIATQLLEPVTDWKVQDFTKNVIEELQKMYKSFSPSCILDVAENLTDPHCHSCMINKKANQTSMNQKHSKNCIQKIEVCIACEKNSFLNPIRCYCGTKLTPNIGYRWAALLVAGKDTKDANRVEISKALTKDVKELEKLLTSLAPRVFGISNNNVRTVVPSAPDKIDDEEKLWPKFKENISYFSQRTDIDTMLIYISCHGAGSNGSGDTKDFQFQLGSSPDDSISLDQFEKQLELLGKIEKLIIVLDRCYPPLLRLEKRNREYIQMNSCKEHQPAQMDDDGSLFTRFFIRGLKAKSEGRICQANCEPCIVYWDGSKDFITVYNLYDYIKGHLGDKQIPFCTTQVTDHNIAFYTGDRVEIQFRHKDSSKNIPLNHLKNMEELKKKLKEAFGRKLELLFLESYISVQEFLTVINT